MPVAIFVLIVAVAIIASALDLSGTLLLDYELQQEDYNALFANLALIALVLERFIEVFNSIWREKGKLPLMREVEAAQTNAKRKEAQDALDTYRQVTEIYAMYGGFAVGVTVALGGVHTLQVLFDTSSIEGLQLMLFQATDILLTAGLLAGGSKGINKVTAVFGNFLEKSASRARGDQTQ